MLLSPSEPRQEMPLDLKLQNLTASLEESLYPYMQREYTFPFGNLIFFSAAWQKICQ